MLYTVMYVNVAQIESITPVVATENIGDSVWNEEAKRGCEVVRFSNLGIQVAKGNVFTGMR